MTTQRAFPATLALAAFAAAACSSSSDDTTGGGGPPAGPGDLTLQRVTHGFGILLPHSILETDPATGQETPRYLRTVDEVRTLVTPEHPIQPPPALPSTATLPNGQPGNQYLLAEFTEDIDPDSFFVACNMGTCEFLDVLAYDPATGTTTTVPARIFIGGQTLNAAGDLERWLDLDPDGTGIVAVSPDATGFPGLSAPQLPNARDLVAPSSIIAVADSDGQLSTFETFPVGTSLKFVLPDYLFSTAGVTLDETAVATTTVGEDLLSPEVVRTLPWDGTQEVDPTTDITLDFTESVQPLSVGSMVAPNPSSVTVTQGPPNLATEFPVTVEPVSAYNLTRLVLKPADTFNGVRADNMQPNSALADVTVSLGLMALDDLARRDIGNGLFAPNQNELEYSSTFRVGVGPGRANTPVVPDALYVSRGGAVPGLSVIDLNGFGQSTGSPILSGTFPEKGETRFPFNPNFLQTGIRPIMQVGTSTIDGGSAGVFTLTLDSNLESILASAPVLADASDIHLGAPLDIALNNGPPPFGCQAGGGNICALDGLKILQLNSGESGLPAGYGNLVSWAPHPNPPRLEYPAQCAFPNIQGVESTSVDSAAQSLNLLIHGDPFGDPATGTPPTGLLRGVLFEERPFVGPSFGQTDPALCAAYGIRQQIGQFMYVADRTRGELVVLNSNRTTALARIPVSDPTSLAISPNLDILAVTSAMDSKVSVIDINPASATFHTVLREIAVGAMPRGVAFDPLDEDILVCNEGDNTISVIDPLTLLVRKTVPSLVDGPFELAVTPRMDGFAFNKGVYFAYVLGRDGQVAVFESGPDGAGGIGYDSTIGLLPFTFSSPKAIQLDPVNLDASVYIAYEGPVDPDTGVAGAPGDGAISRVRIESALIGPQPIGSGSPTFRDIQFGIPLTLSQSGGQLSGVPSDLAFDEMSNIAEEASPASLYTSGAPALYNGKAMIREQGTTIVNTNETGYLLAAVPGEGVVDVLNLGLMIPQLVDVCVNDAGQQSIPVPDVRFLTGYFKQ